MSNHPAYLAGQLDAALNRLAQLRNDLDGVAAVVESVMNALDEMAEPSEADLDRTAENVGIPFYMRVT